MSAQTAVLSIGITVDYTLSEDNKRNLGDIKNDFSKICKRTKKSRS